MMAEKKRWKEFDSLRGMAILMVLLYHSIIVFPIDLHEISWCSSLHTFLWTVQMPLFFLVSGFCYSFRGGYGAYALRKCRRILIPHLVFSLLDILPRMIPNPLVHEQMDGKEAILDFLCYGGSDWFLWTLFVIAMVFPLFDRLYCTGRVGAALTALLGLLLYAIKPFMTDFLLLNMVSQYLLYYILGYILRKKEMILSKLLGQRRNLLPALFCMLAAFAGIPASGQNRYVELLCVAASFFFFFALAGCIGKRLERFLNLCGRWSLQMYLLDAYALVLTRTLLVSILEIRSPVVIICGNFILDTGIVLALSCYLLPKTKLFRVCCGIPEEG